MERGGYLIIFNDTDIIYKYSLLRYEYKYMEWYRSGHNGADSKSVVPPGTVGSNPTHSAKIKASKPISLLAFIFWGAPGMGNSILLPGNIASTHLK